MIQKTNSRKKHDLSQLIIPLAALGILIVFNLIRGIAIGDLGFFSITTRINNDGNMVLSGNLISIIDDASALAIIAMGMTLVTAACGGQDISVGAVGAISGAVFVKVLDAFGLDNISVLSIVVGLLAAIGVTIIFTLFNGTLVAVFKIQPMIATLILFSCGRSIAYMITGSATPQLNDKLINAIGKTIPGIPIPTPIFLVVIMALILGLVFKLTNLRLYTQTVGINQGAARLNGINPTAIKLLSFVLLGVCVSLASMIQVCRLNQLSHKTLLDAIEMDAILAVAIGGNSLGGGKFRLAGSILGSYIILMLTNTLNDMSVKPESIKAYKAIVIIIIVIAGSPAVKEKISAFWKKVHNSSRRAVAGR
ncbi:MAG: ABC transporter permease [Clostridia bacterium]|jgi:simple sugar transport system permease protein|nr:ABC transporter permease [Clostridia bacterium]